MMKCSFFYITVLGREGMIAVDIQPLPTHLMGHPLFACSTAPHPGSPFLPKHSLHFWDWKERKVVQEVNLGADGLIPLEVLRVGSQGKRLNYPLLGQHANLWAGRRVR